MFSFCVSVTRAKACSLQTPSTANPVRSVQYLDLVSTANMAVVVGTWPFSFNAVKVISEQLIERRNYLDALESGINVTEDDPDTGCYFVGRGGLPNAKGFLECDAGVMIGDRCRFGAVAALQGIATPFSVARKVMEKSPHSMLVGEGATEFAVQNGFTVESHESLQTQLSKQAYKNFLQNQAEKTGSHDTIGILVLDSNKNLASGVSSSGMAFKQAGRVGDSPLPGSGLYADNQIGAAAATGDGDKMMRFCPAFHVVQLMKELGFKRASERFHKMLRSKFSSSLGYQAQDACEKVVREAQLKAGTMLNPFEMALIALSKEGDIGAAGTVHYFEDKKCNTSYSGFPFVVWTQGMRTPEIRVEPAVSL